MTKQDSKFNYSEAIDELEKITSFLEDPDADLDLAIQKFERGQEIAKNIELYLKKAENTIRTIKTKP